MFNHVTPAAAGVRSSVGVGEAGGETKGDDREGDGEEGGDGKGEDDAEEPPPSEEVKLPRLLSLRPAGGASSAPLLIDSSSLSNASCVDEDG